MRRSDLSRRHFLTASSLIPFGGLIYTEETNPRPQTTSQFIEPSQKVTVTPTKASVLPNTDTIIPVTIIIEITGGFSVFGNEISAGEASIDLELGDFSLEEHDTNSAFSVSGESPVTISNDEAVVAPSQHAVTLFLKAGDNPRIELVDSNHDDVDDNTPVEYDTSGEVNWDFFANLADQRSNLYDKYGDAYEAAIDGKAWEEQFAEETINILSTIAVDIAKSKATATVADLLDENWVKVLGGAYGLRDGIEGTAMGKAITSTFDLKYDFFDHTHKQSIECAGRSDDVLEDLQELAIDERQAWEEKNRDSIVDALKDQRELLSETSTGSESLYLESRAQRYYPSNLGRACDGIPFPVGPSDTEDEVRDFFEMLMQYALDERQNLRDTLRFIDPPNASVSTVQHHSEIDADLRQLATGDLDELSVEFEVTNGSSAGLTSEEGYLSISHSEILKSVVDESASDDIIDVITHEIGDDIIHSDGSEVPADYPLLDINGQYEPGETKTLVVDFELDGDPIDEDEDDDAFEDVWFKYRSALQPFLIAEDPNTEAGQNEFARAPADEREDDQQGFSSYEVSAGDSQYPPTAKINAPTRAEEGGSVTFDGSDSTAGGDIDSFSWEFDTDGDGSVDETRSGESVNVTFEEPGTATVRLTVTDDLGTENVTETEVTIEELTPLVASFDRRPSVPEPGDEVEFTSTTDADSYDWEINGQSYSGESVSATFDDPGEYEVSLEASRSTERDEINSNFTVEKIEDRLGSPRARIDVPDEIVVGEEVEFLATRSYHPNDEVEIVDYSWNIAGDLFQNDTVQYSFTVLGEVEITLQVTDVNGNVDTVERTISVDESDRQPGETPIWFEDGDINIELITQNTKNTLTSQPVTFFANWIEGSVSRSPAGNQIRRAKLNPEKEKGLFLQGYGGFKKNESEPSNADRTNWRYLINDAIYEKQSRSEAESTFSIDSGTYAEIANDAVSGIESLFTEAESDWLELGDPYWDDNRRAYIIDDASVNLPPEADGDIEVSFDEFNVRIESDGVVTGISAALSIDDETEYLTAEAQLPWDGKVSQPNWVDDEELPDLAWKYNTDFDQGPSTNLSYDIDRDHLYTISESSGETQLVAIERETGVKDWEIDIDELQRVQLLQGILLAVDASGTVYAISPGDGNQIWQIETGEDVLEVDAGRNIFVRSEEKVYAVEPTDGTIHWEVDDPGPILTTPEGLYVKGRRSRLLDLNNGSHIWERTISGSQNPIEVRDGIIYEVDAAGSSVRALDLSDGGHIWGISGRDGPIPDPEGITEIHIIGDQLLLTRGGSRIHAVDIHEGSVSWEFETSSDPTSHSVAFSESNIYMGSSDGVIYSLTFDGSHEKITEIGSRVRQVEVVNDTIFAGTSDGLIAIRRDSGEIIWQIDVGNWDSIEIFDQFLYVSQRSFSPAFYVLEPESLQNDPAQLPPKPIIAERPPRDLDGNGLYEDINGDGIADVSDVQALHQNLGSDSVQDNSEAFNFAGGDPDEVTEADVEALYDRVTGDDSDE